jgi:hypothetical protein
MCRLRLNWTSCLLCWAGRTHPNLTAKARRGSIGIYPCRLIVPGWHGNPDCQFSRKDCNSPHWQAGDSNNHLHEFDSGGFVHCANPLGDFRVYQNLQNDHMFLGTLQGVAGPLAG